MDDFSREFLSSESHSGDESQDSDNGNEASNDPAADNGSAKSYLCPHCDKPFKKNNKLLRHVNETHLQLKKFACSICGKSFKRKQHLQRHEISHSSNPKPFMCDYEGCMMSFTSKQHLERHIKLIHTQQYSLKCEDCDLEFQKKQFYQKHMVQVHHKDKPYKCDVAGCDISFFKFGQLVKHKQKRHHIKKEAAEQAHSSGLQRKLTAPQSQATSSQRQIPDSPDFHTQLGRQTPHSHNHMIQAQVGNSAHGQQALFRPEPQKLQLTEQAYSRNPAQAYFESPQPLLLSAPRQMVLQHSSTSQQQQQQQHIQQWVQPQQQHPALQFQQVIMGNSISEPILVPAQNPLQLQLETEHLQGGIIEQFKKNLEQIQGKTLMSELLDGLEHPAQPQRHKVDAGSSYQQQINGQEVLLTEFPLDHSHYATGISGVGETSKIPDTVNRTPQTKQLYYQCQHKNCYKLYTTQSNLNTHIRANHLQKQFVCKIENCRMEFMHRKSLKQHIKNKHQSDQLLSQPQPDGQNFHLPVEVQQVHN